MVYNIRNILAFIYAVFLYQKIKKVKKNAAEGKIILSVYFHNPSRKLFEFIVKWFKKNDFKFISTDQLCSILKQNNTYPPSSVIMTVDDGWKDNKACIVEVAKKYNIPVTIFITAKPVETGEAFWWSYAETGKKNKIINYTVNQLKNLTNEKRLIELNKIKNEIKLEREALTLNELNEISKYNNITIGGHTLSHPILTKCSDAVSFYEISESKKKLSNWINKPVKYFAYPNGNYSEREKKYLKECGYELSFTTKPDYIKQELRPKPFEIPRFDILENVSLLENICRATGVWFFKR